MSLTITPYVSKCGRMVYLFALSSGALEVVTGVVASPTILVNGSAVAAVGPIWSPLSNRIPFVSYQIPLVASTDTVTYTAAGGWLTTTAGNAPSATAAAVANYTGQLEPGVGGVPGFNMPASQRTMQVGMNMLGPSENYGSTFNNSINWVHRFSNPGYNVVTSTPDGHPLTITGTASWTILHTNTSNYVDGNQYPCVTGVWTFIADDKNPSDMMTVSLNSFSGNATITGGLVSSGTLSGGVQVGRVWQWTTALASSPTSWDCQLILEATTTGATGTYAYTLTNERLFSPAATAAAAPSYPSRANPLAPDPTITHWLTTPSNRSPATIRWFTDIWTGPLTNVVDAADLMDPRRFSFTNSNVATNNGPTGDRIITITAVRTYALSTSGWPAWADGPVTWSSPNVWLAQWNNPTGCPLAAIQVCNGGGAASSTSYATYVDYTAPAVAIDAPTGPSPVQATATATVTSGVVSAITLINPGSGYTTAPTVTITDSTGTGAAAVARGLFTPTDQSWLDASSSASTNVVGEFVTSAPHDLASGQVINLASTPGDDTFLISNGSGAGDTHSTGFTGYMRNLFGIQVWPTSATTCAFAFYPGSFMAGGSGLSLPGGCNNVAGNFPVTYTVELPIPDPDSNPIEIGAATCAAMPNCGLYVNIQTYATDLCAAATAQKIRDLMPKGSKTYVEFSNENWNFAVSQNFTYCMGVLGAWGGLAAGANPQAYIVRASQHHDTFVSVFNATDVNGNTNRGGEIVRVFGGWMSQPNRTTSIVETANAWNVPQAGTTQLATGIVANLFGNSLPANQNNSDTHTYELGMRFQSSVAGFVAGVRFFKGVSNVGTHIGNLWNAAGTNLGTVTFTGETASGWQQQSFPTPIPIAANTTYTVSYYDPNVSGWYSTTGSYFGSPVTSGDLTALATSNGGNGVYHQGSSAFPSTSSGTNYWVDVMFYAGPGPTVTQFGPANGSLAISTTAPSITATFDEPVQPGTITFILTDPNSDVVSSTVTYNSGTMTATLTPNVTLASFTTYTATLSAALDLSGNALTGTTSWSFTTVSAVPIQVDAVCVAPYYDCWSETWPNPTVAAAVNVTGGGSSGGLLAAGTYYVAYSWIDSASGCETAVGSSQSTQFTVSSGDIPQVTIPALPAWALSASIYLTAAGGASSSEVRYATGVTGTTADLALANAGSVSPPVFSQLPSAQLGIASLASSHPTSIAYGYATPWTRAMVWDWFRQTALYDSKYFNWFAGHQAALAAYTPVSTQPRGFVPALICYEGGVEQVVAGTCDTGPDGGGFYLTNQLTHDLYYDPEAYSGVMAVLAMHQRGGVSLSNIFGLCDLPSFGGGYWAIETWGNVIWAGQPAGRGDGSLTSGTQTPAVVTNKFYIDDGKCHHIDNATVFLQAWRDWADSANGPLLGPPFSPLSGGRSRSLNVLPAHDATAVRRVRWEA